MKKPNLFAFFQLLGRKPEAKKDRPREIYRLGHGQQALSEHACSREIALAAVRGWAAGGTVGRFARKQESRVVSSEMVDWW